MSDIIRRGFGKNKKSSYSFSTDYNFGRQNRSQCNSEKVKIIFPEKNKNFVVSANNFNSWKMKEYKNPKGLDDWDSEERYKTVYTALKENKDNCSSEFAVNLICIYVSV